MHVRYPSLNNLLGSLIDAELALEMLFTHPQHRNRGAGSLLVERGIRKADELGLEAYVEASLMGKSVYEKHGFVMMDSADKKLDNPNRNPSEEWRRIVAAVQAGSAALMWRPIGGKYESGKTIVPWEGKPRD